MKVLVLGGGGREHAIVWRLTGDPSPASLVAAPGNPGIARLAATVPIDPTDPDAVLAFAQAAGVDLTVVGPEAPLTRGVADCFAAAGRLLVGPTRAAAEIESSKVFAKAFLHRHGVPTARSRTAGRPDEARAVLDRGEFTFPLVLKADGLAAGKGVIIAADRAEADAAIAAMMVERRFGDAGAQIVIEEHLEGEEVSFFVLTDGRRVVPFLSAQDHKRIFDGDRGPNTGGMGAFAPCPWFDERLEARVLDEIVRPVVAGLADEGREFRGFLYAGLMVTPEGPKVLEFNARLGDPEAQVVLPLLDEDLLPLLVQVARGHLERETCAFRRGAAVGVVLASRGYPDSPQTGQPITGLDALDGQDDVVVFHAGTKERDGRLVTCGGRVLTVVGRGAGHEAAMSRAYAAAAHIDFDGLQKRSDIGLKALGGRLGRR
jgi:phosphoribosylamine--glycine ligase